MATMESSVEGRADWCTRWPERWLQSWRGGNRNQL